MQYVSRSKLVELIKETKGAFFSLYFRKRTPDSNGIHQIRRMNCSTSVAKHVKGTGKPVSASAKLIVVTDMEHHGIRSIPHEGILEATIGGEVYKVK